ncbi:carbohydrate binding protein with CBM6 domain [Actinoallomurus bryophytorum]|uniref:Carbohydrate binding protein with CBM6 domain n=1 Tax=Actinoallomurus bryophytorum TaxID=1490222 RepID=A0A543C1G1_9ACTN|nr:DUF5010 domain-containing protein [Actinoallomurus bryophytorum]TQL90898.1 carbohydrate binding protein with CBM6 domain [Actinoallomurus bryophytorum]
MRGRRRSSLYVTAAVASVAAVVPLAPSGAQAPAGALPARAPAATSGYLGVTFGFSGTTLHGGPYENQGNAVYGIPMFKATSDENAFWDNYVEELLAAGVDFVAPTIRGYIPGKEQYNGGGDTRKLAGLVAAINRAGAADRLKISALDDTPASLTDKKNLDKHNAGGYSPPFDVGDVNGTGEGGLKYWWDNNLRAFFQAVPDNMRFKIDGRPVIYEWSLNDFAFSDQDNGNITKFVNAMRQKAKAEFNVDPYLIADQSWTQQDPSSAAVVDGVHAWFPVPGGETMTTFNGRSYGVTVPGFHFASGSTNMNIDANHGQTLAGNLQKTAGSGAYATLVEGFSDWEENATMWRTEPGTYDQRRYDYPNQMINILRRYSRNPYPADLRVQAESADGYQDTTAGNQWNLYRDGDIDVEKTTDTGGGWDVGGIASGEWLQWQEIPLQGSVTLKARVATTEAGRQLRFVVDGVAGPTVTLPNTGGWQTYQTVNAGTFSLAAGSTHTVRVEFVSGPLNLNYWTN